MKDPILNSIEPLSVTPRRRSKGRAPSRPMTAEETDFPILNSLEQQTGAPRQRSKGRAPSDPVTEKKPSHSPSNGSSFQTPSSFSPLPTARDLSSPRPPESSSSANLPEEQVSEPSSPPISNDANSEVEQIAHAKTLELELFATSAMYALGLTGSVPLPTVRLLFERFREQAKASSEVTENLILDEIFLGHQLVGQIHGHAMDAKTVEHSTRYTNTGAKLMQAVCQAISTFDAHQASGRSANRRSRLKKQPIKDLRGKQKNGRRTGK